ncbi:MAG: SMP-30/gluconolactonase/LRE family protein [Burkholderiaceae bacterium]|nr:SMP-30/gluconolactonase/LRE family protein [Burkholderiaceae bacterium]
MRVLNIISGATLPLTFSELLRAGDLPKATLHRILSTLIREGLLRYDASAKTYQLGLRLLELAHELWSNFDLRLAGQDELNRLHGFTGLPVHLSVPDRQHVVIVDSQDGEPEFKGKSSVGLRLPMHTCAAGKVILAYMSPFERTKIVDTVSAQSPLHNKASALEQLRSELDLSRARGYATEIAADGLLSIAAPILNIEGKPIGAVSVSAPPRQLDASSIHGLSSEVIRSARTITHSAGGQFMTIAPHAAPEMSATFDVQCVAETRSMLGEGPIWSPRDNALVWVDIFTPSIHWYEPLADVDKELKLGSMVSIAIPKSTGGLLVATPTGLMTLDITSKKLSMFCHPESERPGNRYNDGKCDRMGRLWIGTLDMATAANRGSLFKVNADGTSEKMDSGFTVANGLGWSPDNQTMYFTDSARKIIYAYDFDLRAGAISNRRPFVTFAPDDGMPDGLTVDEEGDVWVAVWDAWRVSRYSADGAETMRIRMPVPRPTSCCFGGADLETLYVTSGSVRLDQAALDAAPQSGNLFAIRIPNVRGLPETIFAG